MLTVGIIGMGSLGETLVQMLLRRVYYNLSEVRVVSSCRREERSAHLRSLFGEQLLLVADNMAVADVADVIILAVKPKQMKEVCEEIAPYCVGAELVVSVAAAVPLHKLQEWLPGVNTLARCMPNIPCSIGKGVVTYYQPSAAQVQYFAALFAPNEVVTVKSDAAIDASTVVAGCGPAFFAWFAQCLQHTVNNEIDPMQLQQLLASTMEGTAALLRKNNYQQIIAKVASPKGATEAALVNLTENQVDNTLITALQNAQSRITSISNTL